MSLGMVDNMSPAEVALPEIKNNLQLHYLVLVIT